MARRHQYIFTEERHRGRGFLIGLLVVLFLLAAGLFIFNFAINHSVAYDRQVITVTNLPEKLENWSILHLSDLNGDSVGENQSVVKKAIGSKSASCVVLSGNMVGKRGNAQPVLDLLAVLPRGVPVLLIPGDNDPALYSLDANSLSAYAPWAVELQNAGVTILDQPVSFQRDKATIWFIPVSLYDLDVDSTEAAYQNQLDGLNAMSALTDEQEALRRNAEFHIQRMQRIREAISSIDKDDIQIAVSHLPLTGADVNAARAAASPTQVFSLHNASLILSGGYCGGQWRLPGMGAIYVPEMGFFPEDNRIVGLGYLNGVWQYISPGLGASDDYPFMPFRLFNSPGAAMLVLTSSFN